MAASTAAEPRDNPGAAGAAPPPCLEAVALVGAAMRRRLAAKAEDGRVALAEIDGVVAELSAPDGELAQVLAAQAGKCAHLLAARPARAGRREAFRRLMVRPFETLLEGEPPAFPRACLPQYFKVVNAAGGTWLARTEEVCRTVLQSLLMERGHNLEWDAFYTDARIRHVLAYALRHLVTTLETPAGQWLWERTMLSPDRDGRAPAKEQADLVYRSLRDTWRALELDLHSPQPAGPP